jgi:hypothetical protein
MLSSDLTDAINAWVVELNNQGRVGPVRMPATAPLAVANPQIVGELASRLAQPDPSLGSGPAQWDYQLAPIALVYADLDATTHDELVNALASAVNSYSDFVLSGVNDVAQTIGEGVGVGVQAVGKGIGGFFSGLGVAGWLVVGVPVALVAYAVFTESGRRHSRAAVGHVSALAKTAAIA